MRLPIPVVYGVRLGLLSSVFLLSTVSGAAAFDAGLPPQTESIAYEQFAERPFNDLSVLIYLIDRFKESRLEIIYDGHYFPAPMASLVAKWFLGVQYRGETPREWILKWCTRTVPKGTVIWVRDEKGNFKHSHDILYEELKQLHEACTRDARFQGEEGAACRIEAS